MTEQAPGTPTPPPPVSKGAAYAVMGVVVALVAGCCWGGFKIFGGDDDDDKPPAAVGVVDRPTRTPSPSASPLSPADYSGALKASDQALKSRMASLSGKDRGPLVEALRTEATKLAELTPPTGARRAASDLSAALAIFSGAVQGGGRSSCRAGSATAGLLSSDAAEAVRSAAKALRTANPSYVFGTFLPPAPKELNRRLANGAIITKRGSGGGSLEVKNSDGDKAISLVPTKSKKAVLTFYLRSSKSKTIRGIKSGTYRMFVASGADWDAKSKGFTRDCDFVEFDDTYKFASGYIWTIQLTKQIGGNASTSDADPSQFEG